MIDGERTRQLAAVLLRRLQPLEAIGEFRRCSHDNPELSVSASSGELEFSVSCFGPRLRCALDRLPLTCEGDLRHLWNEATHEVETREMVLHWLCGQAVAKGEQKNLGLYGIVPVDRQRKVANEIASVISTRIGMTPANVVELQKVRA